MDKSSLDKNLLNDEVKLKDKVNVDKEFVLNKGKNKKKRRKPNKNDNDVYVISDLENNDNIELCEFGDKLTEGEEVTVFKL